MRVVVALETRFSRTPDGAVWTRGWLDETFWQRYLDVFDEVNVAARVESVREAPTDAKRADGPRILCADLPYYVGPWRYALTRSALRRAVRRAIRPDDAVILRAPGTIAGLAARTLDAASHPFGLEVVGDPQDVFSSGGVRSILSPLLRRRIPRELRRQCRQACAVAYVTETNLQQRYPAGAGAYVASYSSIDLPDEAFAAASRTAKPSGTLRLLMVGSLEQLYKGPDVLIRAVAECVANGLDVCATIVGDGRERAGLEGLSARLGLHDRVRFAGRLPPGEAVRREMDRADLFVLPSRTEGLPRALLEAMARGVPCIASGVGGVPELLSADELVRPGTSEALSRKIAEVARDPARMARLSAQNLARARAFHADVLRARRRAFYEHVRDVTVRWRGQQPG